MSRPVSLTPCYDHLSWPLLDPSGAFLVLYLTEGGFQSHPHRVTHHRLHLCPYEIVLSAQSEKGGSTCFTKGDFVFAKLKGYKPWPAVIDEVFNNNDKKAPSYTVTFFGDKTTAKINENDLYSYHENLQLYGKEKLDNFKNKRLNNALKEADTAYRATRHQALLAENMDTAQIQNDQSPGNPDETDFETSLTLAAEIGNALLQENDNLKKQICDLKKQNVILETNLTSMEAIGGDNIMLIGDINQIPYINRTGNFEVKFHKISEIAVITKELNITYRCTRSASAILSGHYPQGKMTTSGIEGEMEQHLFDTLESLQHTIDKNKHTCLVFKQSEKHELIKLGFRTSTIHEFQGRQAEDIVIVRKSTKPEDIYNSTPHCLILSVYFTKDRRYTSNWIRKANPLNSQQLLNCTVDKEAENSPPPKEDRVQNNFLAKIQFPKEKYKLQLKKKTTDVLELPLQENKKHSKRRKTKPTDKGLKLTLAHQNINWLSKKTDRLSHFFSDTQPDLIIITEHGLSQENLENTRLDGYTLIGGFTRKTHIKGGVAGYAKNGLEKHIKFLGASNEESELLCETALLKPPRANLEQAIEILQINLNMLFAQRSPLSSWLEELLTSFDLTRLNLPPTRITHESKSSIDWICTKNKGHKQRKYWDDECTRLKSLYIEALEKELCTGRLEDKAETATKKKDYDQRLKTLKKTQTSDYITNADNKSRALWQAKPNQVNKWKLIADNKTLQDPAKIANCLNSYFATAAERTLQANNINIKKYQPGDTPNH
ncbi:hypothetical protein J6590_076516 [Homalodisca vitripennis]|nr:hypothetical protein J6590_076516 [Homalodisca vitripennis]